MIDPKTASSIRQIVRKHLSDTEYQAFIFGSRTTKTHRRFSDVDVGILGKRAVPSDVFFSLQQDLEDSDISYIVEAVDLSQVGKNFKSKALAQAVPLSRLEEALTEAKDQLDKDGVI